VIGGYTPSYLGLDALLVGFYVGKELRFAGSVRAGFNPPMRREVHDQIKHLQIAHCPFTNLPDKRAGAWGQGITAEKMKALVTPGLPTIRELQYEVRGQNDR
jgi:bifunctional non-homologous end joining protein LigD